MIYRLVQSFLLILSLLLAPVRSYSLSVARLSFHDLARQADFVFRGTLSGSKVEETRDGQWIYTVYTFSVSRCYRMTTDKCPKTASVVLLGGQMGENILDVPGVPDLPDGHLKTGHLWPGQNRPAAGRFFVSR